MAVERQPYRVDWTLSNAQVAVLRDDAVRRGFTPCRQLAEELKAIEERLAKHPLDWGEPHYKHPKGGLIVCVGFTKSLTVSYGVHESARIVFVRRVEQNRHTP
jgi:hypothetical protein